ncbi:hypothetical protein BY458DRAFT_480630 [Sporodiniella umbellata]|nr:hypothetical protein BY458DRAFT_480630 [Sporodiniella umbellata]
MVACIYFTDPAISMVFSEMKDNIKRTYVYDYYEMLFEPGSNNDSLSSFPKLVKVAPVQNDRSRGNSSHLAIANNVKKGLLDNIVSEEVEIGHTISDSRSDREDIEKNPVIAPYLVLCMVKGQPVHPGSKGYDIVAATFGDGENFIPNINTNPRNPSQGPYKHARTVPLKVIYPSQPPALSTYVRAESNFSEMAKNAETVEYLVPFRSPLWAKFVHWIMVFVFRTKPTESIENEEPSLDKEERSLKNSVRSSNASSRNLTSYSKRDSDRSKHFTGYYSPDEGVNELTASKDLEDTVKNYTTSERFKNTTKDIGEESPVSKKPPSINLSVLQYSQNYDNISGINTLIDDTMDISSSSATKNPTPSNASTNKNFLRKSSRPTPSVVWNILKPPRSESFSTIAQMALNETGNAIELQKIETISNAPSSPDPSPFQDPVCCDTLKNNLPPTSPNALQNESYVQDASVFTNQLFPRPLSQYPKGKGSQKNRSKQDFAKNIPPLFLQTDLSENSKEPRQAGHSMLSETFKKSPTSTSGTLLNKDDKATPSESDIE